MTIENFFQGIFNFPIQGEMVESACYMRGITDYSNEVSTLTDKERELILADILVMLSRASQTYSNKTGSSDFSMQIDGEMIPLEDRNRMRDEANIIYNKYGETEKVKPLNAINI